MKRLTHQQKTEALNEALRDSKLPKKCFIHCSAPQFVIASKASIRSGIKTHSLYGL